MDSRNIADDVIDAYVRGLSREEIRNLVDLYEVVSDSYHNDYVEDQSSLEHAAKELGISLSPKPVSSEDYRQLAHECLKRISSKLTGLE